MRLFRRLGRRALKAPTYSNSSVIERIQRDAGVDRETATAWFRELLEFLDIVSESRELVSPPRAVDVAWHAFILHTRDYESYCRERYGRVIHHEPTGAADPAAYRRAYERRERAGAMDSTIWALPIGAGTGAVLTDDADQEEGTDVGGEGSPGTDGNAPGAADSGGFGDVAGGGGSSCGGGGCGGGGGGS